MAKVMVLMLLILSLNPTILTLAIRHLKIVVPNRGIVPPSQPSHCTYIPGNKGQPPCYNNPVKGNDAWKNP
ncbi:Uncharacterized protein TCM_020298 [Theobroma cacao]|uniref:Transmembrane protein n=1 Tax=Theobroma cacao TaxID=3641 RepID=A0A061ESJ3_THECC|nr:Uncharacterized protein TCM_020298 [Theobroma cacao]